MVTSKNPSYRSLCECHGLGESQWFCTVPGTPSLGGVIVTPPRVPTWSSLDQLYLRPVLTTSLRQIVCLPICFLEPHHRLAINKLTWMLVFSVPLQPSSVCSPPSPACLNVWNSGSIHSDVQTSPKPHSNASPLLCDSTCKLHQVSNHCFLTKLCQSRAMLTATPSPGMP